MLKSLGLFVFTNISKILIILEFMIGIYFYSKHSKKCTFYTLRFGCSFAAVNTIKPQLL